MALRKWKQADNYCGETYEDYFVGVGRCRDSDYMAEANFDAMLRILGGESKSVIVARASHWAVGWVEQILVHKRAKAKLRILEEAMKALEDYPILCDETYSEYEEKYKQDTFDCCQSEFEKAIREYCRLPWQYESDELATVAREVFEYDCIYRGEMNAFVNEDSIKRAVTTWEFEELAKGGNELAQYMIEQAKDQTSNVVQLFQARA